MEYKEFIEEIKKKAGDFGYSTKSANAVIRDANSDFFIIANEGEPQSGVYQDLSFVVFNNKVNTNLCLLSIGVGSGGFRSDYEEASLPRWRRMFTKLLPQRQRYVKVEDDDVELGVHCKSSFADITSDMDLKAETDLLGFDGKILDSYKKVLPLCMVIDLANVNDLKIAYAWLAQYAKLRRWYQFGNGNDKKAVLKKIENAIEAGEQMCRNSKSESDKEIVKRLLDKHRYVILQGAPGVGKTFLAEELANEYEEVLFTQFHAETTYADFVCGILPDVNADILKYEARKGILLDALEKARSGKKTLLILDEINRANLANVLGPIFYLFEPHREARVNQKYCIKVGGEDVDQLPHNLHVIGTMNTADRSLAVVDYALRRRFVWYTIQPKPFNDMPSLVSHKNLGLVKH